MVRIWIGGLIVAASLVVGYQGAQHSALAQGKSSAGVIEIGEGKDGKFRFFVRDGKGKLLAMSSPTGFKSAKDAEKAVEALKQVVSSAKITMVEKKKDAPKKTKKKDS